MNLLNEFSSVIDRNMIKCLKPNIQAYLLAMKLTNINNPRECILFDDQLPNLVSAKMIGWSTIYIGNNIDHPSIDFCFKNIYDALIFFIDN